MRNRLVFLIELPDLTYTYMYLLDKKKTKATAKHKLCLLRPKNRSWAKNHQAKYGIRVGRLVNN